MFLGGWILCVEEFAEMFRCWNVLYVKRFVVGPVLVGHYVHGDTFCRSYSYLTSCLSSSKLDFISWRRNVGKGKSPNIFYLNFISLQICVKLENKLIKHKEGILLYFNITYRWKNLLMKTLYKFVYSNILPECQLARFRLVEADKEKCNRIRFFLRLSIVIRKYNECANCHAIFI